MKAKKKKKIYRRYLESEQKKNHGKLPEYKESVNEENYLHLS